MDEKEWLCSLNWLKRAVTAAKTDGRRTCVRHATFYYSNGCISPQLQAAASTVGFEPHCSTIFTRAGKIAVPPASLHLDYHHPISCIQLSTVNEESSQTLGPLSSCWYLLRQGAPRVSQAGNITAALKNESYFDSHNVCNATQEPLSDFSSIVV